MSRALAMLLLLLVSGEVLADAPSMPASTSGGGGISKGAADLRYLKLAADNDPLTGNLGLGSGSSAVPGLTFGVDLDTGWSFDADSSWRYTSNGVAQFVLYSRFDGASFGVSMPFAAGTAALPTYSWVGDENTGFYRSAADEVSLSTGGFQRLLFGTTQYGSTTSGAALMTVGAGTAALPTFTFTGDSNTGIYNLAADSIGFTTAGAVRFGIDSTYMTSQAASGAALKFAAGTVALPAFTFNGDVDTGFFRSAGDIVGVSSGAVEIARMSTLGFQMGAAAVTGGANIAVLAGTAALPAYSYNGDLDTGTYRAAANNWAVSAGGVGRLDVDTADITTQLPISAIDGTAAAAAYAFSNGLDAGLSFDSAADGLLLNNNTGHLSLFASGATNDIIMTGADDVQVNATGDDLLLAAGDRLSLTSGSGATGGILMNQRFGGAMITGTGAQAGSMNPHGQDNAAPGAKPTCTAKTDAAYGSIIYYNDADDAVDGQLCMCNATFAAEGVAWRLVASPAVACP